MNLQELATVSGTFTWMGVQSRGRLWRKLDRILFNSHWLSIASSCSVELLNRSTFDHSSLLFICAPSISQPKVFRFQNMWLRRNDFPDVVTTNWNAPVSAYG